MKITKKKLLEIINQELDAYLLEAGGAGIGPSMDPKDAARLADLRRQIANFELKIWT